MAATLDEHGREILDETPVAITVPFDRPEPLHLRIRRMVERYHQEMKEKDEYESFEDADDFDVEDGVLSWEDSPSDYEVEFMPPANPSVHVQKEVTSKQEQGSPAPATEEPPKAEPATETSEK